MKQEKLERAGLSPNEAKCYLTLLKIGSASANEVSRKSGIHRVSVYDALRGLAEKGLVSQITKTNKFLFEAGNPEKILDIINVKEEQLVEAKKIVPELILDFKSAKERQEIHSLLSRRQYEAHERTSSKFHSTNISTFLMMFIRSFLQARS